MDVKAIVIFESTDMSESSSISLQTSSSGAPVEQTYLNEKGVTVVAERVNQLAQQGNFHHPHFSNCAIEVTLEVPGDDASEDSDGEIFFDAQSDFDETEVKEPGGGAHAVEATLSAPGGGAHAVEATLSASGEHRSCGPMQVMYVACASKRLFRKAEVGEPERQKINDSFLKMKNRLGLPKMSYSMRFHTVMVGDKLYDMREAANIKQLFKDVGVERDDEFCGRIRTEFAEFHDELAERLEKLQVPDPTYPGQKCSLLEKPDFTLDLAIWKVPMHLLKMLKLVKEDSGDKGVLTEEGKEMCRKMGELRALYACLLAQCMNNKQRYCEKIACLLQKKASSPLTDDDRERVENELRECENAKEEMTKIIDQLKSGTFMNQADFLLLAAYAKQGDNPSLVQFLSGNTAAEEADSATDQLECREDIVGALRRTNSLGSLLGQSALFGREKRGGMSQLFKKSSVQLTMEENGAVALLSNRIFDIFDIVVGDSPPYAVEAARAGCLRDGPGGLAAASYMQSNPLLGCILLEMFAPQRNQRAFSDDGPVGVAIRRFRVLRDVVRARVDERLNKDKDFPVKKVAKLFGDEKLLKDITQLVGNGQETAAAGA